ncbi:hypothetical protein [Mucilaginibacter jinjuensis]|uniref:Uncharacterized protein n=1 Tax=Mucilaginibacter jinjuensis TaxID=1176721 RepID=A0ABY7T7G2_9SPHI|nr:hypothetical protein [Mucilaginibacter jinjuensis]WCT11663.1 hypothetical protein PQO05_23315 [Mucilaginibacter jinjuensis]
MKENYQLKKKETIAFIILIIVAISFFEFYGIKEDHEADRKNINLEFAGRVERIEYNIKQFPTVTVGDSAYHIGSGYNTDHQIGIGDSIIKRKGSEVYTLIKYNTNKVIEFRK